PRDETVAIWDELDDPAHTNWPLEPSYGGVRCFPPRSNIMTRFIPKNPLVGVLFAVAAVGAGAAFASPVEAPRQVVRYELASLSTDAGARALYARIAKAAEKVCPNNYSLMTSSLVQECREQAVADAVAKIHNQRLAAVHAAASSKSG